MSTIVILVASIALATAGQVLLKSGMDRVGEISGVAMGEVLALVLKVLSTWQVVAGLAAFGVSAILWLVTLSRLPLSVAYPVVALGYVLILAFSVLVLHERPAPLVYVGTALIMVGISLVGIGQRT